MELITYDNVVYYIKKNENESNDMFWERAWFIVKNSNVDNIVNYSKIWQSYKFNNAVYKPEIMNFIINLEDNLYIN